MALYSGNALLHIIYYLADLTAVEAAWERWIPRRLEELRPRLHGLLELQVRPRPSARSLPFLRGSWSPSLWLVLAPVDLVVLLLPLVGDGISNDPVHAGHREDIRRSVRLVYLVRILHLHEQLLGGRLHRCKA